VADRHGRRVRGALVDDHRRRQERAQDRERLQVDARRLQAGVAHRGDQPVHHVPVGGDHDVALALSGLVGEPQHRLRVDHRLVGRDRDLLGGLELDGGAALALVLEQGQLDGADHHPLVRDAQPHALAREPGRAPEALDLRGELVGAHDLAVVDEPRGQGLDRRRGERDPLAGGLQLDARDGAGADVECYDGAHGHDVRVGEGREANRAVSRGSRRTSR
jgi:hypothetical protein